MIGFDIVLGLFAAFVVVLAAQDLYTSIRYADGVISDWRRARRAKR